MSDFILSRDQLAQLIPGNPYVDYWHSAMDRCLPVYDINTPQRIAMFVAQCAHESGNFSTERKFKLPSREPYKSMA